MRTLNIYRPAAIQNAFNDLDKYLESFFGDTILAPAARVFGRMPAVDIQETENAYVLEMELPGYDEKNIDVHVDGTNLTISTKKEDEKRSDESDCAANYLLRERKISAFNRSFKLPENADPEAVSAAFKNGILRLEIKKRAEAQKRMIQINAA